MQLVLVADGYPELGAMCCPMKRCAGPRQPFAGLLAVVFLTLASIAALADPHAAPDGHATTLGRKVEGEAESPAQVRAFLLLLADPEVATWLRQNAGSDAVPNATEHIPGSSLPAVSVTTAISARLKFVRDYAGGLLATLPRIPNELGRALSIFDAQFDGYSRIGIGLLLASFLALGTGVEGLFWRLTSPLRRTDEGAAFDTVSDRVRSVISRFFWSNGMIASFAIGSVGVFLAVDWPGPLREILLTYLLAFLAIRLASLNGRFFLSPPGRAVRLAAPFRLVPVNDRGARFWNRIIIAAAAWLSLGSATIHLLGVFSVSDVSRQILDDGLMLGLALIGVVAVWRAPVSFQEPSRFIERWGRRSLDGVAIFLFLALWLLWLATLHGLFALVLVTCGLPALVAIAQRSVNHILRPPGSEHAADGKWHTVQTVVLERGVRAILITAAAYLLGLAWGLDLASLTMVDTFFTRIVRDILNGVVIVLIADLAWHVTDVLIDNKLREVDAAGGSEHAARRRTLLPILRNVLLVVVVVVAGMLVVAGMGIAVGPLIASAGVLGVALGFGSQTLVRDVISGIFYLFDDAFRVGEYIQSGNYQGTVESFSLRSIKLRHHRGALFTVPFGALGAIKNLSRDWTIEKLSIGVAYRTDIAAVKTLCRTVGKQLLADPELAPSIIETLKLQGIHSFGDYGIQLRFKMMTKAGEQFIVRRRALALIKQTFDANGIAFAFPIVQVTETQVAEPQITELHVNEPQATDVQATDLQATDLQATDLQATNLQATNLQATGLQIRPVAAAAATRLKVTRAAQDHGADEVVGDEAGIHPGHDLTHAHAETQ